jgi:ABC-2 type transport system ATP-binding protein
MAMEKARLEAILHMAGLEDRLDSFTSELSSGWRQRLALGCALLHQPLLIFLDEPTSGLDPRSRLGLWEVIAGQARECKTVFLTTQYLEEADKLANKIAVLDRGRKWQRVFWG